MMPMSPRIRKLALTVHVTASVGWLGAVAVFLALALSGLMNPRAHAVQAAYVAMEVSTWFVIVPLAFASRVTGCVMSLGTSWSTNPGWTTAGDWDTVPTSAPSDPSTIDPGWIDPSAIVCRC